MLAPLDREPDPSGRAWLQAVQVAALFAIDPVGTGGVRVRAHAGPVLDAWLVLLKGLLAGRTWTRVPVSISDERLLGGLDLPATLAAGRPVLQAGVLVSSDNGVIVMPMAERLPGGTAARIAAALDQREVLLERDGLCDRRAARFGVVLLDEGLADDPGVPEALADRLAFDIDLRQVSPTTAMDERMPSTGISHGDVTSAARRLNGIGVPDAASAALCSTALALGVYSMRAPLLAMAVARASAALDGNNECSEDDVQIAASLVLAPRATQWPAAAADDRQAADEEVPTEHDDNVDSAEPDEPDESQQAAAQQHDDPAHDERDRQDADDRDDSNDSNDSNDTEDDAESAVPDHAQQAMEDRVLDAAQAAIPAGLLARLLSGAALPRATAGRAGAQSSGGQRGRPVGSKRAPPASGQRLHLIDTLRAAAPWQRLRQATASSSDGKARVQVRAEDFHVRRIRQKSATTTVFVVDASGSSAMHRLAEAKGAVELLLADCYVRRDQVAVIAFRGKQAELLLPPTRSLVNAKRRLAGLPGGGGTPLANALDVAAELADGIARRGQSPMLVLLTDGRANVARDGSGGRERAMADAMQSGRQLAQRPWPVLLIDTSSKPQREAAELAQAMRAHYLPLPYAGAERLAQSVRSSLHAGAQRLA